MINALERPSSEDLSLFSRFLADNGVIHRVTEQGLNQVIWVQDESAAQIVQNIYERLARGEITFEGDRLPAPRVGQLWRRFKIACRQFPFTVLLLAINIALLPVGLSFPSGPFLELFQAMTFVHIEINGDMVYFTWWRFTFESGELWRLLTPMFLHFSFLHITFNLVMVYYFGRRLEITCGTLLLLFLVLISSLGANVLQYAMSQAGLFGGMSGVVFGLIGFSMVWSALVPMRSLRIVPGVYVFMLLYLAVGFTGAIDLLGLGNLANWAHLGGLIAGVLTGGLAGLLVRLQQTPDPSPPPHNS